MVKIKKKKVLTAEEKQEKQEIEALQRAGIQDEFQAKGFELTDWVQHHKSKVLVGLGALVLMGVVYSYYLFWSANLNEEASIAYLQATSEASDAKQKLEDLLAVQADFASSKVSSLATLYAGHLALSSGDTKEAVSLYKSFNEKNTAKNPLKARGMVGLGYAYAKNNQPKEALEVFESIVQDGLGVGEDLAYWEVVRLSFQLKEFDKARENATLLKEKFPTSPYVLQSSMLVDRIGS